MKGFCIGRNRCDFDSDVGFDLNPTKIEKAKLSCRSRCCQGDGGHAPNFKNGGGSGVRELFPITDGPAGRVVVPLPNGDLFMLGMRDTLLEQAAHQDVRRLTNYKAEHGPMLKRVECVVTERALNELRLPPRVIERASKYGGYYTFELAGQIQYSDTGILFGVLPTTEER